MNTFIASAQCTTNACFDVYNLRRNRHLDVKYQSLSILSTFVETILTIPGSPLSDRVIVTLFVGASCAQFTSKRHYVERMMQITRISLVAYRAIFGTHKQRAAVALIVAIAALNHVGCIPIKYQYLYLRYEHYLNSILQLINSSDMTEFKLNFIWLLPLVLSSELAKQKIESRLQNRPQARELVVQEIANNYSARSVTKQDAAPAA